MADTVRCSKGHENQAGMNFCGYCGEKISGGLVPCSHCGRPVDSAAVFCGWCGKPSADSDSPKVDGMVWQRGPDDFATRIEVDDLKGILTKGIIIEQGTKALLFINGALAEVLPPGRYDLGGLANRLKNFDPYTTSTVVLIDAGDVEFAPLISNVYTKDPLGIDVQCKVVVQVKDFALFYNNLMKGRTSYYVRELKSSLYDEMHNALSQIIGQKSVTELNYDLSLKQEFEAFMESHLRTTFQRLGLDFIQLRTIDYVFKAYDAVRQINQEVFLLISEEDAKLQGRKRFFEMYDQTQLQEIYEETKKNEHYRAMSKVMTDRAWAKTQGFRDMSDAEIARKRAETEKDLGMKEVEADHDVGEWKLAADTRRRIKEHLLDQAKSDEDIERVLLEAEKGKQIRGQEIKELRRALEEKDIDHDTRRRFMLKKLDLEQELDYERQRLIGTEGIERDVLAMQIETKRMAYNAELDEVVVRAATARKMQVDNQMETLKLELARAQTEGEKRKIQIELDRLEDRYDLITLEELNTIKRRDESARVMEAHNIKMAELEAEHRRVMDVKRADQKHELEKIAALADASVEAIISKSGPEQARMIQELKEMEALKGYSEEQIVAMTAHKSPEVAKALQEKYKNMSSEERERLYKQLLEEKEKSSREKDQINADVRSQLEREHGKALDMAKEIAVGVAQAGRPMGPNVVYPPPGQPGYPGPMGPGGARQIACPICHTVINQLPGMAFCPNGHPLPPWP